CSDTTKAAPPVGSFTGGAAANSPWHVHRSLPNRGVPVTAPVKTCHPERSGFCAQRRSHEVEGPRYRQEVNQTMPGILPTARRECDENAPAVLQPLAALLSYV